MPPRDCRCGGAGWDGCPPEDREAIRVEAALQREIEADLLAQVKAGPALERTLNSNLRAVIASGTRPTDARVLPPNSNAAELLADQLNPERRSLRSAERPHP